MDSQLLVLFGVVAVGLLLGRVRLVGLTLGTSGVIFSALAAGYLGFGIPGGIGTVGLVLFAYGIGITAGPGFFRAFRQQGQRLAALAFALVVVAAVTTWGVARLLGIPADLAAGLFAGALTSTPGLAAVMESLPAGSQAAVGYGIAYAFGVLAVVIFVQLIPRILSVDLDTLGKSLASHEDSRRQIKRALVEVLNPAVVGRRVVDLDMVSESNCQITRVLDGDRLVPISRDYAIRDGDHLWLIGRAFRLPPIIALLGRESDRSDYVVDTDRQQQRIVATSPELLGKPLGDLRLLARFGVTVSRIARHEVEFVPDPDDAVQWGDALTVVGKPEDLQGFSTFAGHREKSFDQTDLISLALGMVTGVLLGNVRIGFGDETFSLGMVGGPMLVALLVGHFGRIGRIYGSLPRASRLLLMELGLIFFLAAAGVEAGGQLLEVLRDHGTTLVVAAVAVAVLPIAIGVLFARFVLGLNLLQVLGGVCGGMTSTPGLGVLASKTDSEVPITSYAAAYPVALILMTVVGHVLVAWLT
jgi:putative transport protein